jgi:hypothetical protein
MRHMRLGSTIRFAKEHAEAKRGRRERAAAPRCSGPAGDVPQLSLFKFRKGVNPPPADRFAATTFSGETNTSNESDTVDYSVSTPRRGT